jgi:hypothetical protein
MKLYLDDDIASKLLVRLLVEKGHDVEDPLQAGLAGDDDPVHLTHAIEADRVLLSGNHDDFRTLQNLLLAAEGHHPGMLIVRKDNDPRRDLSPRGIANCIDKIEASQASLADQFIIVNQWR